MEKVVRCQTNLGRERPKEYHPQLGVFYAKKLMENAPSSVLYDDPETTTKLSQIPADVSQADSMVVDGKKEPTVSSQNTRGSPERKKMDIVESPGPLFVFHPLEPELFPIRLRGDSVIGRQTHEGLNNTAISRQHLEVSVTSDHLLIKAVRYFIPLKTHQQAWQKSTIYNQWQRRSFSTHRRSHLHNVSQ
mgnify:FL=1